MIGILEDRAGMVFSDGLRLHLDKVFLQSAGSNTLPDDLRDFALVEAATYWHRPGFAMEDAADRAIGVIFAREAQGSAFSQAEELQLAIAHETLYFLHDQVEDFTLPHLLQG